MPPGHMPLPTLTPVIPPATDTPLFINFTLIFPNKNLLSVILKIQSSTLSPSTSLHRLNTCMSNLYNSL